MTQRSDRSSLIEIVDEYRSLGFKELSNGALLVGHVPHVGPEAWLHLLFRGLSEAELTELDRRLGRRLPDSYRQFLAWHNGLSLFSGALYLAGLRTSYVRAGEAMWQPFALEDSNVTGRPRSARPSDVFIGGYKADGSVTLLSSDGSWVCRCDPTGSTILNQWPSIETMLTDEARRLRGHFDDKGRRLDQARSTAPESTSAVLRSLDTV